MTELFSVDHIASFSAESPSSASSAASADGPATLITADEVVRRFNMLERLQRIVKTRVSLKIGRNYLMVVDPMTHLTMEQFELQLIYRPAVITTGSRFYNNVAMVTVVGNSKQKTPSEVHLFQCIDYPAQRLIDAIMEAKSKLNKADSNVVEAVDTSWPDSVLDYENAARRTADAVRDYERSRSTADPQQRAIQPVNNRQSSDVIIKSVEVLNRCFDDIENFMARLQGVNEAFQELEKRRLGRKKKSPQPGDGLLSLRSRNPLEKDFVDVLQKFKVCFNLVSRLKNHIHTPNAPELVHFLFTPLSLVIEASRSVRKDASIVQNIIVPLLTAGTVQLLRNCLTSTEMELWMSMGEAWTKSRDELSMAVSIPTYRLRFSDGFEPEPLYWDDSSWTEVNLSDKVQQMSMNSRHHNNNNTPVNRPSQPPGVHSRQVNASSSQPQFRDVRQTSGIVTNDVMPDVTYYSGSQLSQQTNRPAAPSAAPLTAPNPPPKPFHAAPAMRDYDLQESFLHDLQKRNASIYQAFRDHESKGSSELTVVRGDILEVLDDSRNWWQVRSHQGQVGLVPYSILRSFTSTVPSVPHLLP